MATGFAGWAALTGALTGVGAAAFGGGAALALTVGLTGAALTGGALAFGTATFFIAFCGAAAFFFAVTAGLLAALGFDFDAFAAGRAFAFAMICLQRVNAA